MNLTYYLTGTAGLCLVSIVALFKTIGSEANPLYKSDGLFLVALSLFLLVAKLSFFDAGMLNIDESIALCAGRMLAFDARAWVSVDPTTCGPINFVPSMILTKLADWASYGELRLFYTLAFQIPTLFILFYTFRKATNPFFARIAIIPLVLTFGFFYFTDFSHASSENVPMFFLTIVLSALFLISFDFEVKRFHLLLAGIACAASFYAKLQVAPIFVYLAAACFILLFFIKKEKKQGLIFLTGFALTHSIALAGIWFYGGFYDFIQSYIVGNLRYTTIIIASTETIRIFILSGIKSLYPILGFGLLLPGILLTMIRRQFTRIDLLYHTGFILTILITVYCIVKPGRYSLHYLLLLIIPLHCYLVWLLVKYSWTPGKFIVPAISLTIALIFYVNTHDATEAVIAEKQQLSDIINQKLVDRLYADRLPGDRMAVWGWGSYYNHAARLLMGTRDVHFDFQTSYESDLGEYYRNRYLTDLEANRPKWFLDISLPGGLLTNENCRLHHYPAIDSFVKKNYHEVYKTSLEVLYQRN